MLNVGWFVENTRPEASLKFSLSLCTDTKLFVSMGSGKGQKCVNLGNFS